MTEATAEMEGLEHVREPGAFRDEAARVTKSGGGILLTVPFAARWHFIPHDYWRFTPSSLRGLLEKHGFADVAVYPSLIPGSHDGRG